MMNLKFSLGDTIYFVARKQEQVVCEMCGGAGKLELVKGGELPCPQCNGTGMVYTGKIIEGDVVSFEPNIIQVDSNGVYYALVGEGGNLLYSCTEKDAYENESDAEVSKTPPVLEI